MHRRIAMLLALVLALAGTTGATAAAGGRSYTVRSIELLIPSRGGTIPATVVMPVGRSTERFPLVVIHHGHGGGRNENGGLARVAAALARAGIVSIRFDFAGAGDSSEPFSHLTVTSMRADSDAALRYAVRNLPVDPDRIGAFGYSEGSEIAAMQAGEPGSPYRAVALLGPVAEPETVFRGVFGSAAFDRYYTAARANGYADVTTPWGQVQRTSLDWFRETIAARPTEDIGYFTGRVLILWGSAEQIIPHSQVTAYEAATAGSAKRTTTVTIPDADHGYGFYSDQPAVDALLHQALVGFFTKGLR